MKIKYAGDYSEKGKHVFPKKENKSDENCLLEEVTFFTQLKVICHRRKKVRTNKYKLMLENLSKSGFCL
jgi:hypothetical protein